MGAGDAWPLIAEREGLPVGFAFFRICDGDWSFETNERMGELEALSVEPELRRWGSARCSWRRSSGAWPPRASASSGWP